MFQISIALTHCKIKIRLMHHYYLYRLMMKLILWGLFIYLLYKFIFGFVIPVSRATKDIKSKIREAQANQQRFQQEQNRTSRQEQFPKKETPPPDAEYIDYEEVK